MLLNRYVGVSLQSFAMLMIEYFMAWPPTAKQYTTVVVFGVKIILRGG